MKGNKEFFIYIYIYKNIYIYIFVCVYVYMYTCIHVYMQMYICIYVYMYICISICWPRHVWRPHIYIYIYIYIQIYIYLYMYMYICIYVYMYICIYKCQGVEASDGTLWTRTSVQPMELDWSSSSESPVACLNALALIYISTRHNPVVIPIDLCFLHLKILYCWVYDAPVKFCKVYKTLLTRRTSKVQKFQVKKKWDDNRGRSGWQQGYASYCNNIILLYYKIAFCICINVYISIYKSNATGSK